MGRWHPGTCAAATDSQRCGPPRKLSAGITFNVYSEDEGNERIFPFSLFPSSSAPTSGTSWRLTGHSPQSRTGLLSYCVSGLVLLLNEVTEHDRGQALDAPKVGVVGDE